MPHKREFSNVLMAWKRTQVQVEAKTSTEALQRQHGEPVRMLSEDWTSVIVKFKSKYGANLQEEELSAQAYFEEFHEKTRCGDAPGRASGSDHLAGRGGGTGPPETGAAEALWDAPPNASLTIQTRRRYTSNLPKDLEELRQKYDVLSNCWLLGRGSRAERSTRTLTRRTSRES